MKKKILKHMKLNHEINGTSYESNVMLVSVEDGSYEVNVSLFTNTKIMDLRSTRYANLEEAAKQFCDISTKSVIEVSFVEDYE